jgi:hypothetical protein
MAIAIPIAAWGVVRSIRRFRAIGPALECGPHGIIVSDVFNRSSPIDYSQIQRVDCDRADRVAYVGGPLGSRGSAENDFRIGDNALIVEKLESRAAAAFRWGFQIVYRDANGARRGLRLFDNDVEGGKAALVAFAGCVRSKTIGGASQQEIGRV